MLDPLVNRLARRRTATQSDGAPPTGNRTTNERNPPPQDRAGHFSSTNGASASARLFSVIRKVLKDQVAIWTFPRHLWHGRYLRPTLLFLAATSLLILIDPRDPAFFRHTRAFSGFNLIVSGNHAAAAMWIVMIAALLMGLVRRDDYLRQTFFLAFEAILSAELLTQVLKGIDRRVRPQDVQQYGSLLDTWFQDKGTWYGGHGSFPSGHMIAAISIATVFAIRYRHHRWAPWTAYILAGVIGFSRITLLSHFPSDVFAATVLGYVIARYAVLREPPGVPAAELGVYAGEEDARVGALG
ncbi:MAG: phosphatase PAP2 family protein [Terriglobia bacterium]